MKKIKGFGFSVLFILLFGINDILAGTYYIATNGDNNNIGSIQYPWKTIEYALTQLTPGDILKLREGIYYESGLTIDLQGTSGQPITIESYSNENVVINGGISTFTDTPNNEWILVDGAIDLYKSSLSFSGDYLNAWLPNDNVHIIEYDIDDNLSSTNYGPVDGFNPLYQGPGIQLRDDGHLYIRLSQNPNDLTDYDGNPISPLPSDVNPNNNSISVFFSKVMFYMEGAKYLIFRNIDFSYSKYIFDVRNSSYNIEFDNCSFNYGNTGILIRDGSSFNIHNCDFNNGLPQYVYWTDVKNGQYEVHEPYPEMQSKAISGPLVTFTISNNLFHDGFDAIGIKDGSSNTSLIGNHFIRYRDDALDVRPEIENIEIADNMFWSVGSGISMTGTDANPLGNVFIHNNVIDNSIRQHGGREGNYRENYWPVWTVISPFGSHGDDEAAWWKVYNNTIVTRKSGYTWTASGPYAVTGNNEKYIMNNIFLILDDRIIFRGDHESTGAFYDGNVFHRVAPGTLPLFLDFGDGNDYNTLSEFQSQAGTSWEIHGLEANPLLDITAITQSPYNASSIWDRYMPMNPQMDTLGASYNGLNWPGIASLDYRGALNPPAPLPVELVAFDVTPLENQMIKIDWTTANETINTHFIIEICGTRNSWKTFIEKKSNGTNFSISNYSLTVKCPYSGSSYYRIKQIDENGNSLSPIRMISFDESTFTIYPNPSDGIFRIEFVENTKHKIIISDIQNNIVFEKEIFGKTGVIDLKDLSDNLYFISLRNNKDTSTKKLIIMR